MRFIRDILADARRAERPTVSVEFFPTKTDEGERTLLEKTVPALSGLAPDFCSVTYGAGGSTRDRTHDIVAWVRGGGPGLAHPSDVLDLMLFTPARAARRLLRRED